MLNFNFWEIPPPLHLIVDKCHYFLKLIVYFINCYYYFVQLEHLNIKWNVGHDWQDLISSCLNTLAPDKFSVELNSKISKTKLFTSMFSKRKIPFNTIPVPKMKPNISQNSQIDELHTKIITSAIIVHQTMFH